MSYPSLYGRCGRKTDDSASGSSPHGSWCYKPCFIGVDSFSSPNKSRKLYLECLTGSICNLFFLNKSFKRQMRPLQRCLEMFVKVHNIRSVNLKIFHEYKKIIIKVLPDKSYKIKLSNRCLNNLPLI